MCDVSRKNTGHSVQHLHFINNHTHGPFKCSKLWHSTSKTFEVNEAIQRCLLVFQNNIVITVPSSTTEQRSAETRVRSTENLLQIFVCCCAVQLQRQSFLQCIHGTNMNYTTTYLINELHQGLCSKVLSRNVRNLWHHGC